MNKIVRPLILLMTIAFTIWLYLHFYSLQSLEDFELAIENKLKEPVDLLEVIEVENEKLVYVKTADQHGYFYMSMGYNKLYRLGSGVMKVDEGFVNFADYEIGDKTYLILMGSQQDDDTIKVNGSPIDIGSSTVFMAIESPYKAAMISSYSYETEAKKVLVELPEKSVFEIKSDEVSNGPREIVIATCLLVLILGFATSNMFTPGINRLEKLYFKWTGTGPVTKDEDDNNDYMMLQ